MRDIALYDYDALSDEARAALCLRAEDDLSDYIAKVTPLIDAVREEGDEAIARFIKQFDGAEVDPAGLLATEAQLIIFAAFMRCKNRKISGGQRFAPA